jgi:hypothetical protein
MMKKIIRLVLLISCLFLFGCSHKVVEPDPHAIEQSEESGNSAKKVVEPGHYIIEQSQSFGNSAKSSSSVFVVEERDGKIISGNYTSSFQDAMDAHDKCSGEYTPDKVNQNICWRINCSAIKEEIKESSCDNDFMKVLSVEDIEARLEDIKQKKTKYPDEEEMVKIYDNKEGCNEDLCYENGIIVEYHQSMMYRSLSWKRTILS